MRVSPAALGHRDVATEADDVVEFQLLGQHPVELLIAEPAIGHDAHLDVRRQGIGQADKRLVLIFVPPVLEGGCVHREPAGDLSPRSRTSVSWQQEWPIKPDLVLGGNLGIDPANGHGDDIDDLALLTTFRYA